MFDIIELTDTELNVVCGGDKSMGQVAKKVILGATDPSGPLPVTLEHCPYTEIIMGLLGE